MTPGDWSGDGEFVFFGGFWVLRCIQDVFACSKDMIYPPYPSLKPSYPLKVGKAPIEYLIFRSSIFRGYYCISFREGIYRHQSLNPDVTELRVFGGCGSHHSHKLNNLNLKMFSLEDCFP